MSAIFLGPPLPPDSPPARVTKPVIEGIGGLLNANYVGLAREIAQGIIPIADLAVVYGFTGVADPKWLDVLAHPEFQRVLGEAVREWNSADGTAKRVRFKAAAAVEANLPVIHEIVNTGTVSAIQRVEAFRTLARLAGMGEGAGNPAHGKGGSGFSVTINIGGGQQVRLSHTPERPTLEGEYDSASETESAAVERMVVNALEG